MLHSCSLLVMEASCCRTAEPHCVWQLSWLASDLAVGYSCGEQADRPPDPFGICVPWVSGQLESKVSPELCRTSHRANCSFKVFDLFSFLTQTYIFLCGSEIVLLETNCFPHYFCLIFCGLHIIQSSTVCPFFCLGQLAQQQLFSRETVLLLLQRSSSCRFLLTPPSNSCSPGKLFCLCFRGQVLADFCLLLPATVVLQGNCFAYASEVQFLQIFFLLGTAQFR